MLAPEPQALDETCEDPGEQWLTYEPPSVQDAILTILPKGKFDQTPSGNFTVDFPDVLEDQYDLQEKDRLVLGTIYRRLCRDNTECIKEVLSGAHVSVEGDGSYFYAFIKDEVPGAYRRISSHESASDQYGHRLGNSLQTILTGTSVEDGNSWFQFEGAPWDPFRDPIGSLRHCVDYLTYKVTGKNVGPLGLSEHTDSNPLRIEAP